MRIERLFVPLQATGSGRDAGAEVYEAHLPVPLPEEDLRGSAAAQHLVRDHRGPGAVRRVAIEQNGRHLAGVGGRLHNTMVHGGMNEALNPALQHHLDGGFLDLPVLPGVDYHQDLAGLPGRLLRTLDDVPGERCRGDLVGYEADGVRPVRAQQPRSGVRSVPELTGGGPDPRTRCLGGAAADDVVEHEGHGGRRNAGKPRHVPDGWRPPRPRPHRSHMHALHQSGCTGERF